MQFDNMVIVTSVEDTLTQKICEYWHVRCIKVRINKDEGFPKGKLINIGLENLKQTDWVVHMDADIYLPPHFKRTMETITLDKDAIYHMDRMNCSNFADWIRFLQKPLVQHENDIFVHSGPFPTATRVASLSRDGIIAIGFFQCFHQGTKNLKYNEEHTSAARGDMLFGMKFPRDKRQFLPECIAIHLETKIKEGEPHGQNWDGRKTPPFTIDGPSNAK
jgi:glycosyltransferase involved in cell wall biosynthesis